MTKNCVGLAIGSLTAGIHLIWVILVAVGLAKPLMDFILSLHFISESYTINPFNITTALGLIIMTFAVGYAIGFVIATLLGVGKK